MPETFSSFSSLLSKKKRYTFSSFSSHFFNGFFKKKIKFFWYPILPAFPASLATLSYHYSIITIHVSCFNSPWATFERWSSFKGLLFQKNVVYIYIYIYTYIYIYIHIYTHIYIYIYTDWTIRANFVEQLQFHRLFSVIFHFGYSLRQSPRLFSIKIFSR